MVHFDDFVLLNFTLYAILPVFFLPFTAFPHSNIILECNHRTTFGYI